MARPALAVVGGGIYGLCTAWAAARQGLSVALLEAGPLPTVAGSSGDLSRAIRRAYGAEAGYTAMVGQAYDSWRALERDVGGGWLSDTGTLLLRYEEEEDAEVAEWFSASAATLAAAHVPAQALDPDTVAARYPVLATHRPLRGLLSGGGVLHAASVQHALLRWLAAQPHVTLLPQHHVVELAPSGSTGVRLACKDGSTLTADGAVVAAGPWARELLAPHTAEAAAEAVPSAQAVLYVDTGAAAHREWARMPVTAHVTGGGGTYILPPRGPLALKVGEHTFSRKQDGLPVAGGQPAPPPPDSEVQALLHSLQALVAAPEQHTAQRGVRCFYTMQRQERLLARPLALAGGSAPSTWWLSACSGHGFKFAPVIAQAVVAAAAGKASAAAVTTWAAGQAPQGALPLCHDALS